MITTVQTLAQRHKMVAPVSGTFWLQLEKVWRCVVHLNKHSTDYNKTLQSKKRINTCLSLFFNVFLFPLV